MRSALSRLFCLLCLVCLAAAAARAQAPAGFTKIYVFGDSLSDTGNFAHQAQSATGLRIPGDIPTLGVDYTDGRFTDGKDTQPAAQAYFGVWIEQLAAGFASRPAVTNSLDGGTNYAFGDATTANTSSVVTEGPLVVSVDNIGKQVADYFADVASKKATAPTPGTLYVLWGGGNDLYNAADGGSDPVAAAQTAATNLFAYVQQLVAAGATSFVVPNLPPLGAVPTYAGQPTGTALNTASALFAQLLSQGLASIKSAAAANGITVTVYPVDILDLFATVGASPTSFGLGNVTGTAQNIPASPDTYLIWDGVHPTTTGHHLVAASAANLVAPLASTTTVLTVPSLLVVGETVAISAKVAPSATSTLTPSGLVTFFHNGTVLGSAPVAAGGNAATTFTVTAALTGASVLTAVYAGDTSFAVSAAAPQTVTVFGVTQPSQTSLTSSAATVAVGASVTLTATVVPTASSLGTATGTVTFSDGTTTLGTATLSNGVATYSTSSLVAGTHSITATYAGGGVLSGSVSSAVTVTVSSPSYTAAASPTSLTITDGGSGTATISAQSTGGFAGALTLSCGTLPAHISCAFSSSTLNVAAAATASSTLTIATNASAALAIPQRPGAFAAPHVLSATLLAPLLGGGLLFGLRRRCSAAAGLARVLGILLLSLGMLTAIIGCGGGSPATAARGNYTVAVTFTPASGSSVAAQTVNLAVSVQ